MNCKHCGAPIDWSYMPPSWQAPYNQCTYCGGELPRWARVEGRSMLTPYGRWIETERQKHVAVLEAISGRSGGRL